MDLSILSVLSTGGDAATIALLYLVFKQSDTINSLKERIIKLETEIEAYIKTEIKYRSHE